MLGCGDAIGGAVERLGCDWLGWRYADAYDLACLEDDRAGVAGVALVSTIRTIKHQYLAIRVAGNMQSEVSGRFVVEVVSFGVL